MLISKMKIMVLVCVTVLSVGGLASTGQGFAKGTLRVATPVIKEFSSTGGSPQNKTGDEDLMYLVKSGEKTTFTVKADGAEKYTWQVNKKAQAKATGNTFAWTVPDEKGIWEIHLTVSNKDGATHQEWVVSTLTRSEAPVIFDYFCPDRSQKDPWDRPLPKWDKKVQGADYMVHSHMVKPSTVAYGTWIFQRKYGPKGKTGTYCWRLSLGEGEVRYYILGKAPGRESWDYRVPSERGIIGAHCFGRRVMGECCSHVWDNSGDWDEVRIIRTKDGWFYIWIGGEFWFESMANENTIKEISHLLLLAPSLDCVEVYDRPLWPAKSIRLGEYVDDRYEDKKHVTHKVKRTGVIIDGHGVRLVDIAEAIGDPKIFRYDPVTGTAVCYTDLVIYPGAELIIDNETLRMHCDKDGEHQIRVGNCSTIRLNRATVTSDNKFYYNWAFTSPCKWEWYRKWSGFASYNYSGRFLAADSTISNCGNLFIDTPGEMVLKRCKLVDLVEVDIGNYWECSGVYHNTSKRRAARGKKGLWFYNRKTLHQFRIEDCVIHGRDKPLDITFIGGDDIHNAAILNSDLDNIAVKSGYVFRDWRVLWPFQTEQMGCTVSLVNCKFADLKAQTNKAWILPKYYLDVLVVDKDGKPTPECKVRVINEVDDINYPAENLHQKRVQAYYKVWPDVNDLRTAVPTGKDGHTAFPVVKTNTIVLTDFARDKVERREFTYTVQVTAPDGRYGERKGVNPGPGWYRPDPLNPTHTVKVVLDKAAPPPVKREKRKKSPAKVAKSPWPCFRGPDQAHTGRSPNVGPKKPRLLWRYKTGEGATTSPVIAKDGTIYISARVSGLHAINPDGSRKWRYPISIGYPQFPPAVGPDGTVYQGEGSGANRRLHAISPDGKLKWKFEHPSGHEQSAAIPGPDGTIYYAAGGFKKERLNQFWLYAIRPDGKLKWTGGYEGRTHGAYGQGQCCSSPTVAADGTVYIGGSHVMTAVHALKPDGTSKWTYKAKGRVVSTPAISIADKTVYVGSRIGGSRWYLEGNIKGGLLLALEFDGSLKWEFKTAGEITCSPAIGAAGEVYFGSRDGYFYAVGKDGKEKWKYKTGDHTHSSPAIDADGKIYFGSLNHYVYCLSPKGKLVWRYLTGCSVTSSPAIGANGTVYIGSSDGYLYAFGR
ncbi:MAG: PQQ-like beta-propeller repeat protein [Phycisphaerae bacterium]|nr:PQQ-like beta-propeller repeat protein [Phycisphaerae bacterium]